jgi:hypothetical protein
MFETREKALWEEPAFWVIAVIVSAGLVGGVYYYNQQKQPPVEQAQVQKPPAPAPAAAEPAIKNPIPQPAPEQEAEPLPPLAESDTVVRNRLGWLVSEAAVEQWVKPEAVIRNFVITVDNLPRKKVNAEKRPLNAVPGQPVSVGSGDVVTLSEESYARYAPLIKAVQSADTRQLADLYVRFYPLFQQAYEDLGYPDMYFNDRLVEVIDHLLQTPEVRGPIELVQPNVFYEYADPRLESRSAGQKTLIRMGPRNAAIIKQKLQELRQEIVKQSPAPQAAN